MNDRTYVTKFRRKYARVGSKNEFFWTATLCGTRLGEFPTEELAWAEINKFTKDGKG